MQTAFGFWCLYLNLDMFWFPWFVSTNFDSTRNIHVMIIHIDRSSFAVHSGQWALASFFSSNSLHSHRVVFKTTPRRFVGVNVKFVFHHIYHSAFDDVSNGHDKTISHINPGQEICARTLIYIYRSRWTIFGRNVRLHSFYHLFGVQESIAKLWVQRSDRVCMRCS